MNFLTLSNPNPIFNPPILSPHCTKSSISAFKSVSGFCSVPKWVLHSQKHTGYFPKPEFDSKFNNGYLNMGKRVSGVCFSYTIGVDFESGNEEDAFYMRKGVELAKQAIGCTSPNPMVGCIIVKDGQIVGQGFHPKAGQPHAEVFALRDAGEQAENATAYVTLEPCNHYGKTPPCSEALIKAKVKKVVVGMVDPNPIVSSRGINRLKEAGIEVVVGVEEDLCKKLNEAFIHKMISGKPFVTLRYTISTNAVLLDQLGEKVTECGGYYSQLLQEYDAVIHATTTMNQELSFLASQEPNAHQPQHIFIAKKSDFLNWNLDLPAEANCKAIIFSDKEVTLASELSQKGIETVVMDDISLDAILEYCSRQGMCNVLIDLRGKLDGLEEILEEGFLTNSMQKVVVEVLPLWAGNETSCSTMMSVARSKRLTDLSTRIVRDSVLLEGYF
ncbi:riboflavin biosynthesis protein PYRD, chloroplastic-like [Chenopodium quinoa]|uniref:Riboflavin biosynthesis protein PYRD, chloroplastic n=1 Tax=Chenopodium quinoa TaxID=63459 RepID=A0A803M2V3_CHEQI|nr:riboflavin biosynthesis protein PYRD, chloroplastic-like [Chenopodium quinoa]